jgi:NAD(P)-dependent dehydrogenase (short-subunit alcohol dehydrogenase family)
MGKLDGKVAIVTGAGSSGPGLGTGKATSILFAREGASVVLVDKFEDRAADTLRQIEGEGGTAHVVIADLARPAECQRAVDEGIARFGGVDILVNNAAIPLSKGILDTTPEVYEQVVAINLTAPFMLCRAAIPSMIARGGGAIVFISSIAAIRGQGGQGQTAYAASKAGLYGLTIDLADSFGRQGIRVNTVAPGIIDTPMRNTAIIQSGGDPKKMNLGATTSLGVDGDAWDIAGAVLFLAGPDGDYITGVTLPVDGGKCSASPRHVAPA